MPVIVPPNHYSTWLQAEVIMPGCSLWRDQGRTLYREPTEERWLRARLAKALSALSSDDSPRPSSAGTGACAARRLDPYNQRSRPFFPRLGGRPDALAHDRHASLHFQVRKTALERRDYLSHPSRPGHYATPDSSEQQRRYCAVPTIKRPPVRQAIAIACSRRATPRLNGPDWRGTNPRTKI